MGVTVIATTIISTIAGMAATKIVTKATGNEKLGMIAGIAAGFATGAGLKNMMSPASTAGATANAGANVGSAANTAATAGTAEAAVTAGSNAAAGAGAGGIMDYMNAVDAGFATNGVEGLASGSSPSLIQAPPTGFDGMLAEATSAASTVPFGTQASIGAEANLIAADGLGGADEVQRAMEIPDKPLTEAPVQSPAPAPAPTESIVPTTDTSALTGMNANAIPSSAPAELIDASQLTPTNVSGASPTMTDLGADLGTEMGPVNELGTRDLVNQSAGSVPNPDAAIDQAFADTAGPEVIDGTKNAYQPANQVTQASVPDAANIDLDTTIKPNQTTTNLNPAKLDTLGKTTVPGADPANSLISDANKGLLEGTESLTGETAGTEAVEGAAKQSPNIKPGFDARGGMTPKAPPKPTGAGMSSAQKGIPVVDGSGGGATQYVQPGAGGTNQPGMWDKFKKATGTEDLFKSARDANGNLQETWYQNAKGEGTFLGNMAKESAAGLGKALLASGSGGNSDYADAMRLKYADEAARREEMQKFIDSGGMNLGLNQSNMTPSLMELNRNHPYYNRQMVMNRIQARQAAMAKRRAAEAANQQGAV